MKASLIDYSKGRERTVDYISVAAGIANSYPDPLIDGIDSAGHGVQKDAVQNGWDARLSKKAVLQVTFEFVKNKKGRFLLMEDNGVGLTGKVWTRPQLEKLDAQGKEAPESERWARFESFGFRTETAGGIGSRGQGKFLFINASQSNEILYETRLQDGTYRVGATKATRVGCPMRHWEGKAAERLLAEHTGLSPINFAGTRVIICEVEPSLAKAVRNGSFMKAIEETWWRNVEKGRAAITVRWDGKGTHAKVPPIFPIPTQESKGLPKHKGVDVKVWRPDLKKLHLPDGGRFKAFELCYRDDVAIPEELRGVAVLHCGMKIMSISPQYLPKEISDSIYGYVEFDEAVDEELRKRENQKSNHYDLVWSRPLPRTIKQIIRDQITEFALTKLGQGGSPQEKIAQLQADAEKIALRELLAACKELGIELTQPGPVGPTGGKDPPPPRPLGVMFHDLVWPTPGSRRVEHGQPVEFDLILFNTTAGSYSDCQLAARVFTVKGGQSLKSVTNNRVSLPAGARNIAAGHYQVVFDAKTFPPGEYVIRATLHDHQGYKLDEQSVRVFVAQEPPMRSPFELVADDWSDAQDWANVTHFLSLTPDPKVTYNFKHPRYVDAEAAGDVKELAFYLYGLLVQASIQFAMYLGPASPSGYASIFSSASITSSDPYRIVEDVHRVQGLLMASWK